MGEQEYVVQMKGITKVYPNGVAANQGVDFNVKRGEIHALMGENGAGKSTLMKMLFGLEQPTEGEIFINGKKETLSSPTAAISKGIGMVHQHFMLVPNLTVAENMVLGMEPKQKSLFLDYKKIAEKNMEETGGRLCWGRYVEDTVPQEKHIEIYDGVNLPGFTLAHEERQETQGFGGGMAL